MKTILSLLIAFMVVSVEAKEALVKITLGKTSAPAMTALKPGGDSPPVQRAALRFPWIMDSSERAQIPAYFCNLGT
jgi:hypothetical protein